MSIPALSRAYFTRANQPFGVNNTTQLKLESFWVWSLAANLLNLVTTGTTAGARHANSIWICRGSSNGVTANAVTSPGVAGVNNWGGGTFPGDFVRGNNGSASSWMVLENSFLGLELYLRLSASAAYLSMSTAPLGTYTGGTTTVPPAPPSTSVAGLGATAWDGTTGGHFSFFGNTAGAGGSPSLNGIGATWYFNFVTADSGEFLVLSSFAGRAYFTNFAALWKTTGQQAGDTRNVFILQGTMDNTRGAPATATINSNSFCGSVQPAGTYKTAGGVVTYYGGGQSVIAGQGVDAISGVFLAQPCEIIENTPQHVRRGTLPDIYVIGTANIGGAVPNGVNQSYIVAGDILVPFPTVPPLI